MGDLPVSHSGVAPIDTLAGFVIIVAFVKVKNTRSMAREPYKYRLAILLTVMKNQEVHLAAGALRRFLSTLAIPAAGASQRSPLGITCLRSVLNAPGSLNNWSGR
jgi:hypothetical protein